MDIQTLTTFFMWATILGVGMMIYWSIMLICCPNFIYRFHSKWFPMPRETWNIVIYAFLGLYKIVLITLIIIPYIALLIIR